MDFRRKHPGLSSFATFTDLTRKGSLRLYPGKSMGVFNQMVVMKGIHEKR